MLYSSKLCAAHEFGLTAMLVIMSLAAVAPSIGWAQGGPVNLSNDPYLDWSPVWSPDGSKIAFVSASYSTRGGRGLPYIYVMDANGDNPVRLTTGNWPAWSPDGTKIAFNYDDEIYVMDANGDNRVAPIFGHEGHYPAWSPDGSKIAFRRSVGEEGGQYEIYVMDANGDNPVRLTRSIYRDDEGTTRYYLSYRPAWSPDGTKIAFVSNRDNISLWKDNIYVMDANGGNPVQLTRSNSRDYGEDGLIFSHSMGPAWSPDGTKIAFVFGRENRESDIYVMPSGFSALTPTEHGDTRERATAVGPDSTTPGTLEQRGDVDYFRVEVTQAGRLTVGTTGGTDTVGYLQNQEGRHLAGDDDAGPEASFEIVREVGPGTYYVAVVGGEGRTATGAYTLQVRFTAGEGGGGPATDHGNTRAKAAPVGVNTRTSAALERAGDVDYFRVEITQAGSLVVETTGTTDTFGYVGGASGGWLAQNDDGGAESNFRITRDVMAGTYYVAVVGFNRTATGPYTLAVRFAGSGGGGGGEGPVEHGNSRAQATRVAVDTNTAGALEQAGDVDYFRVEVPAAGQLRIATSGDTDTLGYFGGADGRWLSQNDDNGTDVNFRLVRQVTAGTYYVAVVGGEGRTTTGAYTFYVGFTADGAAADHGDTRERATRVEVNTQTEGALERAGDVDYFRVAVPRAGRLTVETTGTTDTFGYVGGASGGWLAQDDDGGTGLNFRIARDVTAGTYYVAVAGFNRTATGPYTLAVRFAAP